MNHFEDMTLLLPPKSIRILKDVPLTDSSANQVRLLLLLVLNDLSSHFKIVSMDCALMAVIGTSFMFKPILMITVFIGEDVLILIILVTSNLFIL